MLKDDLLANAILADYRRAPLEERQLAMLGYVEKLTLDPASVGRADLDRLRAHDFSDRDLLHIVEVAAYYAYANRIADGLGVELEAGADD